MNYKDIITITENNYHEYEEALIALYKSVFAGDPYCEEFTKEEIQEKFIKYFIFKHNKFIVKMVGDIPVSFCVGYNAYYEKDEDLKSLCEKMSLDLKKYYYIAGLGTDKRFLKRGYAKELLTLFIHSNTDQYSNFLLRTTGSDNKSLSLYDKFYFKKIEGVYDSVKAKRTDGNEGVDHRVYLHLDALDAGRC